MDVVHACGIKPQSITLIGGGRAALTGGKCWRISAACSSITVPGAMSARRWGRPGWRSWRFTTRQTALAAEAAAAEQAHRPDDRRVAHYAPQRETFRQIYQQLKPLMS